MLIINCKVDHYNVQRAAQLVMKHYKNLDFLNQICAISKFNETNDSGEKVAVKIFDADIIIEVVPYKTWSPFSKVIGYAKGNTIYVNTRKIDLPVVDRAANFMHEAIHLLGYSHKGNKNNAYNDLTVPYRVGDLFGEYLKKNFNYNQG